MYKSSCTCEILHRTPLIHRVDFGPDRFPIVDTFLPFGTKWFWALYLCMLDPADTYRALWNTTINCVPSSKVTITYNMSEKNDSSCLYRPDKESRRDTGMKPTGLKTDIFCCSMMLLCFLEVEFTFTLSWMSIYNCILKTNILYRNTAV